MNLFVFPDAVNRYEDSEKIKLNIDGDKFHMITGNTKNTIDTSLLRDGSTTMVLNNGDIDNTFVLYNFREILQALNLTPQEMLHSLNLRGFMQIDKCNGDLFIKVFLLKGDSCLESDTDDFSSYAHCTLDYIHPLDWAYSWTVKHVNAELDGDYVNIEFDLLKSDFWSRDVYVSHGGQSAKLVVGHNKVRFKYIDTENAYIGEENCRYKGRMIDLERLVYVNQRR